MRRCAPKVTVSVKKVIKIIKAFFLKLDEIMSAKAKIYSMAGRIIRGEMEVHVQSDVAVNGKLKEETHCGLPALGLEIKKFPLPLNWEEVITCRMCKHGIYSCMDQGNPR